VPVLDVDRTQLLQRDPAKVANNLQLCQLAVPLSRFACEPLSVVKPFAQILGGCDFGRINSSAAFHLSEKPD
jgi:hypothetical protein